MLPINVNTYEDASSSQPNMSFRLKKSRGAGRKQPVLSSAYAIHELPQLSLVTLWYRPSSRIWRSLLYCLDSTTWRKTGDILGRMWLCVEKQVHST